LYASPDDPEKHEFITLGRMLVPERGRFAKEMKHLRNLVKRFSGAINSQGDAGDSIDWVCYSDAGRTLWFASDEMGGSGKAVMSFALAARDGGSGGNGCDNTNGHSG
jgi:hypothetical protein